MIKVKDINGNKTDIDNIAEWVGKKGQVIERLHIYNMHEIEVPLGEITKDIQLYNYNWSISLDEIIKEYSFVDVIYKHTWKCVCGNEAYNYNIRSAEAGETRICPHCGKEVHTYDDRNWG